MPENSNYVYFSRFLQSFQAKVIDFILSVNVPMYHFQFVEVGSILPFIIFFIALESLKSISLKQCHQHNDFSLEICRNYQQCRAVFFHCYHFSSTRPLDLTNRSSRLFKSQIMDPRSASLQS